MDATTKAAKAVASGTDAATAPSSPLAAAAPEAVKRRQEPLLSEVATAVCPASSTVTTASAIEETGGGCEDEQVERFYALLANIRAMRGMYRSSSGSGGACSSTDVTGGASGGGGEGRKRARWAEPVWRPAFRMEDFQEAPGRASKKERRNVDGASRRPGKETSTDEAAGGD